MINLERLNSWEKAYMNPLSVLRSSVFDLCYTNIKEEETLRDKIERVGYAFFQIMRKNEGAPSDDLIARFNEDAENLLKNASLIVPNNYQSTDEKVTDILNSSLFQLMIEGRNPTEKFQSYSLDIDKSFRIWKKKEKEIDDISLSEPLRGYLATFSESFDDSDFSTQSLPEEMVREFTELLLLSETIQYTYTLANFSFSGRISSFGGIEASQFHSELKVGGTLGEDFKPYLKILARVPDDYHQLYLFIIDDYLYELKKTDKLPESLNPIIDAIIEKNDTLPILDQETIDELRNQLNEFTEFSPLNAKFTFGEDEIDSLDLFYYLRSQDQELYQKVPDKLKEMIKGYPEEYHRQLNLLTVELLKLELRKAKNSDCSCVIL